MKDFFKYTLATIVGILLLFSVISALFSLIMTPIMLLSETSTKLSKHSVYEISMEGVVAERAAEDDIMNIFMNAAGRDVPNTVGLNDLLSNIKLAKEDKNVDGIYLKGGSLSAAPASLQELRHALLDFKESGKFIVAYAEDYAQSNYYLASVADEVYINPQGELAWGGLGGLHMYYKDLLEKLGIEMQVVKVGTFKSAVEPYVCTEMSAADRLQTERYLGEIWKVMVDDVAASRNLTAEKLNAYADEFMKYQPQEKYVQYGLVDSLLFKQDMKDVLTRLTGTEDYELVSHSDMLGVESAKNSAKDEIAIIYAEGEITDSEGNGIVGKDMVKTINKVAKDDDVKAVVFRVNSPGGSAYASEQICHAITLLKEKKPVVVSMGDYAASGGYYISSNSDYIIAQPNTITGSIGIFGLIPSFAGTFDKLGLHVDAVSTNRLSTFEGDIVYKGMSPEERDIMQSYVNRGYELFTLRCAEGRNMAQDDIKKIAEGRVWTGTAALELGLVDQLGDIQTAIDKAAELAEIEKYKVVDFPEQDDEITMLIKMLTGEDDDDADESLFIREMKRVERLAKEPSIQARLPYYMEIH